MIDLTKTTEIFQAIAINGLNRVDDCYAAITDI